MNFLIKTLGCRVNQAESQEIAKALRLKGWKEKEQACLIILNTCSVTNKAEKETRQTARALRRKYPKSFLVVIGCAVDYWCMKKETPDLGANLLVENKRKLKTPAVLSRCFNLTNTGCLHILIPRVFLKIQDGCNQFCAYCIVPYLRSRSKSISVEKVTKKIKKLEKKGAKEIILCGINLADYKPSLTSLLKKVLLETNIPRIRLGSINLGAFSEKFIDLYQNPRLCPHFHIPLQSAYNKTLERMGRRHTIENFKNQISKIKKKVPNVNITTDILVGFPGETEEEFKECLNGLRSLKGLMGKIHVFRYSIREGTKAAEMKNQVSELVKMKRAQKIRELDQKMGEEFSNQFIGEKLQVLFEKEKDGYWEGLSENHIRVRVKERDLRDEIKVVKIEKQKGGILYGRAAVDND